VTPGGHGGGINSTGMTAGARGTQSTHRSCGAWQQTEGTKKAQTEKREGEKKIKKGSLLVSMYCGQAQYKI
jgi:hypothetical protein